jgi:ParB family chromosome partitioning protein
MIVPDPAQPRREFSQQEMEELTASIRARGIKQPLTVRWDTERSKYMIIDGGRRYLAASRLQLEELPCWIQQGEKKDVLIDQIVHNWQRSSLRPYETADALARLRDEFGVSQQELSQVTGKPKGEISKLLALHDKVVPAVQELARSESGEAVLTKRHLYNISRLEPERQQAVAVQVKREGLTAIDTERLVAEQTGSTERPKRHKGMAARRRRYRTSRADVLMTFHKANVTEEDVLAVLDELRRTIIG